MPVSLWQEKASYNILTVQMQFKLVYLWEIFPIHFSVWRPKMAGTHLDLHTAGKYLLGCCYLCWGALEIKTNQTQITLMGRLSLPDSTIEIKYNSWKEILALFPDIKSKSSAQNDIPLLLFIPNQITDYGSVCIYICIYMHLYIYKTKSVRTEIFSVSWPGISSWTPKKY